MIDNCEKCEFYGGTLDCVEGNHVVCEKLEKMKPEGHRAAFLKSWVNIMPHFCRFATPKPEPSEFEQAWCDFTDSTMPEGVRSKSPRDIFKAGWNAAVEALGKKRDSMVLRFDDIQKFYYYKAEEISEAISSLHEE